MKKISYNNEYLKKETLKLSNFSYLPSGHWKLLNWAEGATDGGSSGAGLFNHKGQIIGALSGGSSSCTYQHNDYFFRFDLAWDINADDSKHLSHWLDPENTGCTEIDFYEQTEVKLCKRITHIHDSSEVTIKKIPTIGNIAGNNNINITRFVEKYENDDKKQILGFYFVASEGSPASVVNATIWEGNHYPEKEVYNEILLIKEWINNNNSGWGDIGGNYPKNNLSMRENYYQLSAPIEVNSNYFIGFEIENNTGQPDFGILVSDTNSKGNALYYDSEWHSYTELIGHNKATTLWIDPIVVNQELSSNVRNHCHTKPKLYPNPIKAGQNLVLGNVDEIKNIRICNMLGQQQQFKYSKIASDKIRIDINKLTTGIYILTADEQHYMFEKQ